jgi:hypothetical protein
MLSVVENRDVALEVRPIPPSSVEDVPGGIAAIDDARHLVNHHYRKPAPTMYDHLDSSDATRVDCAPWAESAG